MKESIWTKDFLAHTISYLLMSSAFYFLLPTLPIYVVKGLGEDASKVGYIIGFYAFSALLVRPFAGYALDAFGRKTIYLSALVFYAILLGAYAFASTFFALIIVRLLHGVSWGVITTGGSTITADLVPASKRGQGIGYFGLSITLSMALGPVAGLWILGDQNFNKLFYCAFGIGILAIVMASFIKIPEFSNRNNKIRWNTIFEKKVGHIAFVMFLVAIPFAGIFSFITLYGDQLGVENSGLFFLVYAAGVSILRPIAGKLMDKRGPSLLMLVSFITTTAGLFLLAESVNANWFLMAAFVIGLGNGVIMPTIQTMIINMVSMDRRGTANATFFSAIDLGIGLGSVILGYLAEWTSISTMYFICAIINLVPMLYFFIFVKKHYYKTIDNINFAN